MTADEMIESIRTEASVRKLAELHPSIEEILDIFDRELKSYSQGAIVTALSIAIGIIIADSEKAIVSFEIANGVRLTAEDRFRIQDAVTRMAYRDAIQARDHADPVTRH